MDDETGADKYRKRTKLFQQIVVGVNTLLQRWAQTSHSSTDTLHKIDLAVDEVIQDTESSVIELGARFRAVTQKTRRQTELAMALLRQSEASGAAAADKALGLPDYIRLYDAKLKDVTLQLGLYSVVADEMAVHQKKVREEAGVMDEILDELRSMSAKISKISLDSSVAATRQEFDKDTFISMTDRVRNISEQSHDLTRRAHHGLDSIRQEINAVAKRTQQAATSAREASERAASDVEHLNARMLQKSAEIEATLHNINALGGEIQRDINQIIVAMQFQDITQQKLEKVKGANLLPIQQSLSVLSHETRAWMQRDLYRAILAYSESSIKPGSAASSVPPESAGQAGAQADTLAHLQSVVPASARRDEASVANKKTELF